MTGGGVLHRISQLRARGHVAGIVGDGGRHAGNENNATIGNRRIPEVIVWSHHRNHPCPSIDRLGTGNPIHTPESRNRRTVPASVVV